MIYRDKLKDPRWQRKRLEIMQLHDFKCQRCGSGIKTLHVHHRRYLMEREPWDYPNALLECLCEDCHSNEHSQTKPPAIDRLRLTDRERIAAREIALDPSKLMVFRDLDLERLMPVVSDLQRFSKAELDAEIAHLTKIGHLGSDPKS